MVTMIGFFFILANIVLLVIFMPDLVGPVCRADTPSSLELRHRGIHADDLLSWNQGPAWLYYSFALGLFMYQTMDNIDGKQARRTGTSSGLGELFDHGIDSLNCTLASLLETAAMGLGTSKVGVFTALCPCLPMFFSTWETYHSHTLYLGYVNGPTEGLLIACALMAISGYYGPAIWTTPIRDNLGKDHLFGYADQLGDLCVRDIWVLIIVGGFFVHVPGCIKHVVQARHRQGLPIAPVFLEWTPFTIYACSIAAWLYSPYSTLCSENHLVLFCITMSFVFGRMTTKMILAHLTRQPFPYWTVMLFPLVGGALLGNLPRFGLPQVSAQVELYYLYGYFIFAAIVYFRWAFLVTNAICDFLGINALTIPYEKQMENKRLHQVANGQTNGILNGSTKRKD